MNLNLLQTELSLKTKLGLYLALTLTKKNFKLFSLKIKSGTMLVHQAKGQPAASTYVREKGCVKKDSNRDTPCIIKVREGDIITIYEVNTSTSHI